MGFNSNNEFEALRFKSNHSYVLKTGIVPSDLTQDLHREHAAFSSSSEAFAPAGLQRVGASFVEFCLEITYPSGAKFFTFESGYYGDKFSFNVETGKFSHVFAGFELTDGGASFVEVGRCRRTN